MAETANRRLSHHAGMDRSVFQKRVDTLRQSLKGIPPDTAWIIQPENRRYLSGFKAEDTQFTESSGSLLINETQCVLVTDSRYTSEAEKEAPDYDVQTLKNSLVEEFPGLVKRLGTENLGFEEDYLPWGLHRKLTEKTGEISLPLCVTPMKAVVEEMREVKDDQEIRALTASAELISSILDEVVAGLKPGLTEREVAWQIQGLAHASEADGLAFPPIVASGPNGALPHAVPTNRKLGSGEPIVLDMGIKLNGYCSDMTRTIFLGDPLPEFRDIYITVRKAQLAALQEIRPGMDSNQPDAIAREVIREAGFGDYFGHALGHGVGLATHEQPRLSPQNPVRLKKGMVVTVEPGIYIPGKGGVRLEEMVVIEEGGARILTKADHFYDFMP